MKFSHFIIFFFFLIGACSLPTSEKKPNIYSPGSISGSSEQGINLTELMSRKENGAGLPINALLWRASIDIASTLPLQDIDALAGTVITDWYQLDENSNDRIKLAIFVLDRELRSDGIRVIVYLQKRNGGIWSDYGTDREMGLNLEELILTRAREIRASSVNETE